MPYTAIIVEDEPLLRASFVRHVNWTACGFTVAYDCASAEEAIIWRKKIFPICFLQIFVCSK